MIREEGGGGLEKWVVVEEARSVGGQCEGGNYGCKNER